MSLVLITGRWRCDGDDEKLTLMIVYTFLDCRAFGGCCCCSHSVLLGILITDVDQKAYQCISICT